MSAHPSKSAGGPEFTELVALQAEHSHGSVYLAMLVERAIALCRLIGHEESLFEIHLFDFRTRSEAPQVETAPTERESLWSRLEREGQVVLPSGLQLRSWRERRFRLRHWALAIFVRAGLRLQDLMSPLSVNGSIGATCAILRIRFSGVVVGDLVMSTALRSNPESVAYPHRTQRLGIMLASAAGRVAATLKRQRSLQTSATTAIWCTPEQSYLQAILPRAATQNQPGLQLVDDAEGTISLIFTSNLEPVPPLLVVPPVGLTDRSWALEHLSNRLQSLGERTVEACDQAGFAPHDETDQSQIDILLFLHDFADGEFMNGIDGLGSNFQWAQFTLNQLSGRSGLRVFVKPHPAIHMDSKFARQVRGLLDKLRNSSADSMTWIDSSCSPQNHLRLGSSVGITRYGTVAEELVFCGIPAVASINAPYAAHHFATHWQDLKAYSRVLHDLPRIASRGVSAVQREACLDYVFRRHSQWGLPFWKRAVDALSESQNGVHEPRDWYSLEKHLRSASVDEFYALVEQTSRTCPVVDRRHLAL